ncbi:MAG: RES family NAD+ phosphorylase [Candidatus Omnitrophica bacterium]|nr:RES family NAD+ phosphorylase [Candidatus Omnitrophota bacterium]
MEEHHTKESLQKSLRGVKPSRIIGVYFRLVSPKRVDEILSTQGSFAYGGRYNPDGEFGALYLGETEKLCKAERQTKSKNSLLISQIMGKIKVSYGKILDLTDPETLKKLKIKKAELLSEEKDGGWVLTWAIARLAYQLGFEGILSPSITGTENNLVIFDKYVDSKKVKIISKSEKRAQKK